MRVSLIITTYNWPEALACVWEGIKQQTVMPDEIIIADDGSGQATKAQIDIIKNNSTVPVIHVWQEDKGFRRTFILNKAIAAASGDYIIQIDGDVFPECHFIEDHIYMAQEGCFVCGSRVKLDAKESEKIFSNKENVLKINNLSIAYFLNSFRNRTISRFLAFRYAQKNIGKLRGCNIAYWKKDVIKVNGYNENIIGWGQEDSEFAYRLHFAGVRKKFLKMGGVVYHLWHKECSKDCVPKNMGEMQRIIETQASFCENGIDKYL